MNEKNVTFEQSMKRLEEILKMFQEGTELIRSCSKLLDEAELQVKKVMAQPDGSPSEEDFPHDGF